jgi:cellulose biosynthesis protein BcsQ
LGLDPQQSPNRYEVYTGTKPAALAIRKTRFGIDVLSSHPLMAAIEEALEPEDEVKLAEYLTPLKPDYDFILVDAPGHKTKLHDNALVAADLGWDSRLAEPPARNPLEKIRSPAPRAADSL